MKARTLLDLKENLTLPDAARRLSTDFKEDVTAADVLQLGLEGHLRLSFNFVNPSPAVLGAVISSEGKKAVLFPTWFGTRVVRLPAAIGDICSPVGNVPEFGEDVEAITGVWDLLMIEDGPYAIQRLYQQELGGPTVVPTIEDGIILRSSEGRFARLQVRSEQRHPSRTHRHNYKLAHDLPMADGMLIVCRDALMQFAQMAIERDSRASDLLGMGEILLPHDKKYVTVEEIPDLIANALHPDSRIRVDTESNSSNADAVYLARATAAEEHEKHLRLAIRNGELVIRNRVSLLPMPAISMPSAVVLVDDFVTYAKRLRIAVQVDFVEISDILLPLVERLVEAQTDLWWKEGQNYDIRRDVAVAIATMHLQNRVRDMVNAGEIAALKGHPQGDRELLCDAPWGFSRLDAERLRQSLWGGEDLSPPVWREVNEKADRQEIRRMQYQAQEEPKRTPNPIAPDGGNPKATQLVTVRAQRGQEILRAIRELGYDPKALPKNSAGKDGVKKQVRTRLNFTPDSFDHTWKWLRSVGEVADAS